MQNINDTIRDGDLCANGPQRLADAEEKIPASKAGNGNGTRGPYYTIIGPGDGEGEMRILAVPKSLLPGL